MTREHFGKMPDGRDVDLIRLDNGTISCGIITCGAALMSLKVPDKSGKLTDVVLGFDSTDAYLENGKYIGAVIGRYANRIGGSRFSLGGKEYPVYANNLPNHLHGGKEGFDRRIWDCAPIPFGARFSLISPHMDEGYPGNLEVSVDYVLEGSSLIIKYSAKSDRDTICNLTNHAYFNLNGHSAGSILGHELKLFSKYYTPVSDKQSIPTGEIAEVSGTPMDFSLPTVIGSRIDADFDQLSFGSGYDHNWVVDGEIGVLRPAAWARGEESGIAMRVETTSPGIQFYSGNFLDGCAPGKGGAVYKKRSGFCLETQFYPDSPNKPQFPPATLKAGEPWVHTTAFGFEVNTIDS